MCVCSRKSLAILSTNKKKRYSRILGDLKQLAQLKSTLKPNIHTLPDKCLLENNSYQSHTWVRMGGVSWAWMAIHRHRTRQTTGPGWPRESCRRANAAPQQTRIESSTPWRMKSSVRVWWYYARISGSQVKTTLKINHMLLLINLSSWLFPIRPWTIIHLHYTSFKAKTVHFRMSN